MIDEHYKWKVSSPSTEFYLVRVKVGVSLSGVLYVVHFHFG